MRAQTLDRERRRHDNASCRSPDRVSQEGSQWHHSLRYTWHGLASRSEACAAPIVCMEGAYHECKPVGWEARRAGDAGKCPATDDGLLYAATGSLYTRATRGVRHLRPSRVCLLGVDPLGGAGVHYCEII